MEKKIGIMTFHASYNCGSILQTIALQETLRERFKIESEVIDFSNINQQKLYSVYYRKINTKNLVKNLLCVPGNKIIKQHYDEYARYIPNNINLSKEKYSKTSELYNIENDYDAFICGSDQIWNVNCDDFDDAYFLSFVKGKPKIAYAPSLGATNILNHENKEKYKQFLSDFTGISTREDNGSKWIGELTEKEVPVVLDPSMLCDKEFWDKKIDFEPDSPKEDYIFYYAFGYNDENNIALNNIAEELNLKVVVIDSKQWYIKRLNRFKNFYLSKNTGPNAFLYFIKNCKYVATASFHGCAFSVNYHKNFIYLKSSKHNDSDDRTSGLLKKLDLSNRIYKSPELNSKMFNDEIDYEDVDKRKKQMVENSLLYLEENLKKAKLI